MGRTATATGAERVFALGEPLPFSDDDLRLGGSVLVEISLEPVARVRRRR